MCSSGYRLFVVEVNLIRQETAWVPNTAGRTPPVRTLPASPSFWLSVWLSSVLLLFGAQHFLPLTSSTCCAAPLCPLRSCHSLLVSPRKPLSSALVHPFSPPPFVFHTEDLLVLSAALTVMTGAVVVATVEKYYSDRSKTEPWYKSYIVEQLVWRWQLQRTPAGLVWLFYSLWVRSTHVYYINVPIFQTVSELHTVSPVNLAHANPVSSEPSGNIFKH